MALEISLPVLISDSLLFKNWLTLQLPVENGIQAGILGIVSLGKQTVLNNHDVKKINK